MAAKLTELDYQRLAAFRYHLRRFFAFSEHAAAQKGLSPQQHQALLAIKGMPRWRITVGVLAERLGVRHNTAVELINRLIANGFVERRQSCEDRREVLIKLTGRAEALLAKFRPAHRHELKMLPPLLQELLEHLENPPPKSTRRGRKR